MARKKKSKKTQILNISSIVNAIIIVLVLVGRCLIVPVLYLWNLLNKSTRFVVISMSNAGKYFSRNVVSKLEKKLTNNVKNARKYLKVWLKRQEKYFEAAIKMPNKYALKAISTRKIVANKHRPIAGKKHYKKDSSTLSKLIGKMKIFLSGGAFTLLFIVAPITAYTWYRGLPQPGLLVENTQTHRPTRILDRKGQTLYEIYVDKKYAPVALSEIPKNVIFATLAVEDHEFYNHHGVRPLSIVRAAKATIVDDSMQGGSTITQQLIKNVLLSPERTITRKLKELFLAFAVEKRYSKEEILELYLNNIPYGGTAWGIQSASQKYFGKNVGDLNLGEAAFLAGLPSSPSSYMSYANDIDMARKRQKFVLGRMEELSIITHDQSIEASEQDLNFVEQAEYIKAPHFVQYVRKELERKYGRSMVESGGLTVKTSLDLDLQERLQEVVAEEVSKSGPLNITNGALVVLDPKSGEILAYVGSIDYFREDWGAYDVVTALRQPGSTIKVVTYALALEKGYTAASTVVDAPLTIQLGGGMKYTPVNYDGKYHGKVTLRAALANSYNIPAVKLVKDLGPDNMVTLGKKMGLTNWEVDDSYGYSVTLGGKETRLLDLTNVYATFARNGTYLSTTPFISVKDANGFDIYSLGSLQSQQAVSPESSYIINNILSDNYARSSAFGSRSSLYIPGYTVAAKTGTTNEKRDNYTIGYTPSFVVGVWVGNNNNAPMNPYLASGVSGAAPIWNKAMKIVLEGAKNEPFEIPEDVFVKMDSRCGRSEVFTKGSKVPDLCPDTKDSDKKDDKKDDKEN